MVYDLIVIGGGPAGYLGAQRAGHEGLNVLLIEKRFIGGVCLNEGCIPSKTLLYSAKICDYARHGSNYGVTFENVKLDHEAVISRKEKVVNFLVSGVKMQLKKNKVNIVEGFGEIAGKNNEGYVVKVKDQFFTGKRLLIATGSEPIIPPVKGVKEGIERGYVLTNREIFDLKSIPKSLAIIGGGVIGLEMASYFNSAGSRVAIIEALDHIAGNTDSEISQILYDEYINKGIQIFLNSRMVEIDENTVVFESKGLKDSFQADNVLMSIGRKPVTDGIGLDKIGVEIERGHIRTDNRGRTNIPEVYAAGDVNGYSMLAHTAYREAEVCINNMLGKRDIMRYNAIPSVIYTNPEVASVGETEETASQKGIDFIASRIPMQYSGRYMAENKDGKGICKIIVDKKHKKLLGVHMVGSYASEMIYGAGLMIECEMRVDDIKELVFPHPTVSEIIRECIFTFD